MRMSLKEAEELGNALLDAVELATANDAEAVITRVKDSFVAFIGEEDSYTAMIVDAPIPEQEDLRIVA